MSNAKAMLQQIDYGKKVRRIAVLQRELIKKKGDMSDRAENAESGA